ncbi:MAG: response regulator [Ktedonobacterales bacterium]
MCVVLVVEDDTEIRATLRMALEDDGYTVLEAENGEAALAQLRKNAAPMVVLLDLVLPLRSGASVLETVASDADLATRHAYILVTAADQSFHPPFTDVLKQLQVPVVQKPFDLDTLFDAVTHARERVGA